MENTISLLKSLVKVNTESSQSNLPLIYLIQGILERYGFKTVIQKVKVGSVIKGNLVAKIGKGVGGLLFSGHTDTVPAGGGWKTNPLKLTKKDNLYFGLGAVDVKGFLAVIITVACHIAQQKGVLKKPLSLAFTFDEEINLLGVKKLLLSKSLSANFIKPDLVVVGEPTRMKPVLAHKGIVGLQIKIFGREAHGSSPDLGINAIEGAAQLVSGLKKITLPPHSTLCISKIEGGSAINKVPGFCLLQLEYRPTSQSSLKKIFYQIQKLVSQVMDNEKGLKIKIEKLFETPPFQTPSDSKIGLEVQKIISKRAISVAYATEAAIYSQYNFPVIVLGPGDIQRAHRPNEFIARAELDEAGNICQKLIQKFCF